MLFLDNEPSEELTISPKAFRYAPKANSKQKCMNTTQEHEKGTLLQGYSSWRADLLAVANRWRADSALCHIIARRGEQTTRRGEL